MRTTERSQGDAGGEGEETKHDSYYSKAGRLDKCSEIEMEDEI